MTTCISDTHNRPINYLRVSVTDRCNLRCRYCMPEEGVATCTHADILTFEETARVVRAAASLGINAVRLTGGEPLVRLGCVDLVRFVAQTPGITDVAMTTNAVLLASQAEALKEAGLKRVNISLDTLDRRRFAAISRVDALPQVLAGIEAAQRIGLSPVKINTVVMRGINDDEIVALARTGSDRGWHVRFIELMPLGQSGEQYVSCEETRQRLEQELGQLTPVGARETVNGAGPARYFRLPGASGTVGFISPVSNHFCDQCNRLRLTADGRLRPCLLSERETDLRALLRSGATDGDLAEAVTEAIRLKPLSHHLAEHEAPKGRTMSQIGG